MPATERCGHAIRTVYDEFSEHVCLHVQDVWTLFIEKKNKYVNMQFSLRVCTLPLYVEHRPVYCSNPGWPAALIRIQQPEALLGRLAD